jgi:hypothetical protein
METRKNLCAMLPVALHTRVRQEQEKAGMTLGEYVEAMITEYYDWKDGKIMTGEMRTLAAQIPAELFDRLDRYLKERGIKKKDFLVDIITRALEEVEAAETVDPTDPYKLTEEEKDIVQKLHNSFTGSEKLRTHMKCLFRYGCMYNVCNSNLLFHASMPLNEDGSLKEVLELQDLGTTIPTLYGNFSLNVDYKNLSFFVSGDYQAGSYVHSFDRQFRFAKGLKDPSIPDKALEGTTQGAAWLNFTNFFVEKADYLKIRNIGAYYTIKPKRYLKEICFGFNVYNPFSFTAASVDPEALLSGARSQGAVATGGLNYSSYSTPRQYIGSVKVNF